MKGIPWHIFPTTFSSFPSALSPGTRARPKPGCPAQALRSYCKKFSERQSNKWEVDLLGFREKRPFYRVPAMEGGLSFASRANSYANEREDHPSHWFTDWGLKFARLDPIDFNRFMLCSGAVSFFQSLCSAPTSFLFHAPLPSPIRVHNVASIIY